MKIDVSSWKKFRFGDLIDSIYKAKAYSKEEIVLCDSFAKNIIPYVTRTDLNNSVEGFAKNEDLEFIEEGNAIIVGDTTATVSYQKEKFICGDHIVVIRAKWLNTYTGLFITTILKQEKFKYCYGRAYIMNSIENTEILLPANGDNPDYQKMEDIIKSLNCNPITTKNNGSEIKINTDTLKEYDYPEIFIIKKGFYNKKPDHNVAGNIPFLGATAKDNGVTEYYSLEDIESASKTGDENNVDISEKIFEGKALCVTNNGSVGFAFYQPSQFTCSHDVNPLYLIDRDFNEYIALFIGTVIMKDRYRWTYGRKWRPERMMKSKIKLPAKADGTLDYEFMENYIKSLPYGDKI